MTENTTICWLRRGIHVLRIRNAEIRRDLSVVLEKITAERAQNLTPQPPSLEGKGE